MGAASRQSSWNSSSRWEQRRQCSCCQPSGTPLQQTVTWRGPSSDLPPEFAEAQPQRRHIGADANPPWRWCVRERVLTQSMEDHLERSDNFDVVTTKEQHFPAQPKGQCELHLDICRTRVRRTWIKKKSQCFRQLDGEVAKIGRFTKDLQEHQDRSYKDLQNTIKLQTRLETSQAPAHSQVRGCPRSTIVARMCLAARLMELNAASLPLLRSVFVSGLCMAKLPNSLAVHGSGG